MNPRRLALLALAAAAIALSPGCKTVKSKVCDHLESLMADNGESGFSRIACEEQVKINQERCSNFEEVADCWLGAEDISAFGACRGQCRPSE